MFQDIEPHVFNVGMLFVDAREDDLALVYGDGENGGQLGEVWSAHDEKGRLVLPACGEIPGDMRFRYLFSVDDTRIFLATRSSKEAGSAEFPRVLGDGLEGEGVATAADSDVASSAASIGGNATQGVGARQSVGAAQNGNSAQDVGVGQGAAAAQGGNALQSGSETQTVGTARGFAEGQERPFGFLRVASLFSALPDPLVLAAVTGLHLDNWYRDNVFCGRCGTMLRASGEERALACDECGNIVYPRISPAVIVAVTDGDKLLLTRYARGSYRKRALVAGFVEVGETAEQAVARGLRGMRRAC